MLSRDAIITTRLDSTSGELQVDRFGDVDGDGRADSTVPFNTTDIGEVGTLWEAGKQLPAVDTTARTILTWVDLDNNEVVDSGEVIEFSREHLDTLARYLAAGAAWLTPAKLVDFIRGHRVPGLRDRRIRFSDEHVRLAGAWKLGGQRPLTACRGRPPA